MSILALDIAIDCRRSGSLRAIDLVFRWRYTLRRNVSLFGFMLRSRHPTKSLFGFRIESLLLLGLLQLLLHLSRRLHVVRIAAEVWRIRRNFCGRLLLARRNLIDCLQLRRQFRGGYCRRGSLRIGANQRGCIGAHAKLAQWVGKARLQNGIRIHIEIAVRADGHIRRRAMRTVLQSETMLHRLLCTRIRRNHIR